MITDSNDKISTSQAIVLLINYILGVGILTLPRTSIEKVKTPDVWITVILSGLTAMVIGIVIVKLGQQYPGKTFYQYSQDLVGKWIGGIIGLLVILYFISVASFEVRALAEVTEFFLLEGTPTWAIIMPFMWIGLYLITSGINPIARLFEIIVPITIVLFLLVICISCRELELNNLRPVLGLGVLPVLKGLKSTAFAYSGAEVMLFIIAFMKKPDKAVKVIVIGTGIPMLFYLITVIAVIGVLTIDGVVRDTWPTITLVKNSEIPGLIFERFESMLLTIWIMQIFSTFTITFYLASLGLFQIFKMNSHICMYGLIPVIYIISMIPKNVNNLFELGDFLGNVALYLFGVLPVLLLIFSRIRGKTK